jgi:transcriptional regulator with XRE-family HTH domain
MAEPEREPPMVEQLRRAILDSGRSLYELSKACHVDRGRLSRFMRHERDLTLTAAGKICEALGISLVGPAPEPTAPVKKARRPKGGV